MILQRPSSRGTILYCAILTIIVLFTYTALDKLFHLSLFKNTMERAGVYPRLSGVISITVPLAELSITAMLFFERTTYIGLIATEVLMILFTLYTGLLLSFHKHLPCSCGGIIALLTWKQHLIFNIVYSVFVGIAILSYRKWHIETVHVK